MIIPRAKPFPWQREKNSICEYSSEKTAIHPLYNNHFFLKDLLMKKFSSFLARLSLKIYFEKAKKKYRVGFRFMTASSSKNNTEESRRYKRNRRSNKKIKKKNLFMLIKWKEKICMKLTFKNTYSFVATALIKRKFS